MGMISRYRASCEDKKYRRGSFSAISCTKVTAKHRAPWRSNFVMKKGGVAACRHCRRVPDTVSSAYQCGWRRQDANTSSCFIQAMPTTVAEYMKLQAGIDARKILSSGKGLRAVASWVMSEGLLARFSQAK